MSSGRGRDARAAKGLVAKDLPEPDAPQEPMAVIDDAVWENPAAGANTVLAAARRLREQLIGNLDVTTAALAEERALHRATAQRLVQVEEELAAARIAWAEERAALVGEKDTDT